MPRANFTTAEHRRPHCPDDQVQWVPPADDEVRDARYWIERNNRGAGHSEATAKADMALALRHAQEDEQA